MTKIQVRRGTAAEWTASTVPLDEGEIGYETDTGKFKIGKKTGVNLTSWTSLPYAKSGAATILDNAVTFGTNLSGGTFNGTTAVTVNVANPVVANLTGNADTATALDTAVNLNGTSFDGSANALIPGAIYGTAKSASATFSHVFVSPSTSAPSDPANGDVWISW